jgi:putative glycerol-1-phosphate prenyltransferase
VQKTILPLLHSKRQVNEKLLAILIDPDFHTEKSLGELLSLIKTSTIDLILVGGSLLVTDKFSNTISIIKKANIDKPLIIFPGNYNAIDESVDAFLLLNLISGRNAEYLIGQHVVAAPMLYGKNIEILSTSYILVDGGTQTTVSYISGTMPIPRHKPEIALATAQAGELIGHQIIFLDCGSGASQSVPDNMVKLVSSKTNNPLWVGGGIKSATDVLAKWESGADVVVIGTAIEQNMDFLNEVSALRLELTNK